MKISVRLTPNVKKDGGVTIDGDIFRVRVAAPAVDGRANQAAIELLAEYFAVRKRDVTLVGGETKRNKIFVINNGKN